MEGLLNSKEVTIAVIAAIAAVIAAGIAATATVIGPFVATKISRRQTTATLRQQWIDKLRDEISEFLSIINHYMIVDAPLGPDDDEPEVYRRLLYLESKIQLMLNRHEHDHKELIAMIGEAIVTIHKDSSLEDEKINLISEIHNRIISLSQEILKREWQRVKED